MPQTRIGSDKSPGQSRCLCIVLDDSADRVSRQALGLDVAASADGAEQRRGRIGRTEG